MKIYWFSLAILFSLAFGSCTPSSSGAEVSPDLSPSATKGDIPTKAFLSTALTESSIQGDETQTDPSLPIPAVASLQTLIEKAKEDLAQRLSVPASQINLIEAKKVFWPDASLGCPQPGIAYTQVEVPGYRIMLEAGGNEFEYHTNIHNSVFYCENPNPPIMETPAIVNP
jgi:hypothetical protein